MADKKRVLVTFEDMGRITVGTVRQSSVLSALNVAAFGKQVLKRVKGTRGIHLLLNFEHVDYLSSAVLTELLRINKIVQEAEGQMRICAVAPNIREIFEITNLDKLFVLSEDDAQTSVKRFERALAVAAREATWREPAAEA